jgi:hypothetical protein
MPDQQQFRAAVFIDYFSAMLVSETIKFSMAPTSITEDAWEP